MAQPSQVLSRRLLSLFKLDPAEARPVLWSSGYLFFLLSSYYVLRPIRDDVAVASGLENLPWLFTATLAATLLFHPFFTSLVKRLPRERFIAITYRFFSSNLLIFFLLFRLSDGGSNIWAGRVFYVWTNVFNLFVVSVFWAGIVDIFGTQEAKRVFGLIALGGTLGAILGSSITTVLAPRIGPPQLLLFSVLLIEAAILAMRALNRAGAPLELGSPLKQAALESPAATRPLLSPNGSSPALKGSESPIGGTVWAGLRNVAGSRFLIGIAAFMLCYTLTASFLYFQQAEIIGSHFTNRAERTSVFASIDLVANLVTVLGQLFLTSRVMGWLAVGGTLAVLPAICITGFSLLGNAPSVGLLIAFQVIRRASDYTLTRPARETLYTVLGREDKYKSKNFIDTFVYRVGDQTGAWGYAGLTFIGLSLQNIAWLAVGVSVIWFLIGLWLGRRQEEHQSSRV